MVACNRCSVSGSTEKERQMRNYKTSRAKRVTYRYYDANGNLHSELVPGQDDVTEVLVQYLHAEDDEEYNASRREAYHAPVHYMAYSCGDGEDAEARNGYLGDEDADPAIIFENMICQAEFKRMFYECWNRLSKEQKTLVFRKARGETNVAIAKELGISETAIRKQIKRIQKHFSDIH